MEQPGKMIENPSTGELFEVRRSGSETNGELLEAVITIRAGGPGPPGHVHPVVEERLKVVAGTLEADLDGERRTLNAGDELTVAPGVAHKIWNEGDEDVSFEAEIRPALRMQTFFETISGLARDGKTNDKGIPNPLQASVLLAEYRDEMQLTDMPAFVQRLLALVVAPIGRLLGFKARYPEYSGE